MKRALYIILIFLSASSCQKSGIGDCFKNTGPIITESRGASPFTYLHMKNNVDVFLTHDQQYSISVRAGKNIIQGIKTTISDNTLTIQNDNSCNWIRSFENPIEVYLGIPKLDSILYQSSGNLRSLNRIVGDFIQLDVIEGAGSINLEIEMNKSWFNLHYGTVDLRVSGYSHINYLYSGGYGPADLHSLNTVFNYMTNNSTNNCYVRASYMLDVRIFNVGDVYYYGNPTTITTEISGTGKLYKE
ncbi:MAG: DUF2807 domain-containing protein [Bacteroidetes bacterium]|nr:DUF2807 domain-containing protein [Bacteroidota bacterium]